MKGKKPSQDAKNRFSSGWRRETKDAALGEGGTEKSPWDSESVLNGHYTAEKAKGNSIQTERK